MNMVLQTGEIPLQLVISLVSIIGAGISVFVGLKIANAENRKDIEHLGLLIKQITDTIKELDRECQAHRTNEHHVQHSHLKQIERRLDEMFRNDEAAHIRLESKIDKLTERLYGNK